MCAASFPTSFCVTVSMMVPKAGIVDILTELKAAGKQDNGLTIHSHCIPILGILKFPNKSVFK